MLKPKYHVFICRRHRNPDGGRPSCEANNAEAVYESLYPELESRNLLDIVQLTITHCLGQCDHGPIAVIYPEGVWYGHLKPEDAVELVEDHLVRGKIVGRKVI